ncbi:MAG: XTP/dITP diphosphatase [Methanobacteriota archaeon]|nr:MAG: XTP/dITP diphosphatase [Euryarchaeota archaeon]
MKPIVVLATRNIHKIEEIKDILKDVPVEIRSLQDFPEVPEIEETGHTFEENALIKAETVFNLTGHWAVGDDSGLEVDALKGAPGIYSARYAGPTKSYEANNIKLLEELSGLPASQRKAQFHCAAAIVGPDTRKVVHGILRGMITFEPRGSAGFGYDPLFIPEGYEQTLAELGEEIKNKISHRARAFQQVGEFLLKILQNSGMLK